MKRWNLINVVYYSKNNKRKILEFKPNDVTIITGASNTGKSAIINTIDYCLGSSNCNIASYVIERTTHVSTKWTNGDIEFLLSREVLDNDKGSNNMFIEYGSNVKIPLYTKDLNGRGTKDQIRLVVEKLFGFSEVNDSELKINENRITLRQLVPFMYLDKSVIDSDRILFHGLDHSQKSKYIIEALPYFLGAVSKEELRALRKLKDLKRGLNKEEKKRDLYKAQEKDVLVKGMGLIKEAKQYGVDIGYFKSEDKEELFEKLNELINWEPKSIILENKDFQDELIKEKSTLVYEINTLKRKKKAVIRESKKKEDYSSILRKQTAKLDIHKYFLNDSSQCPICESSLNNAVKADSNIRKAFSELSNETEKVDAHNPGYEKYISDIESNIALLNEKLNAVSHDLESLLKRSKEARKLKDNNILASRVIGRISYFLESQNNLGGFDTSKIDRYSKEIVDINNRYGSSYQKERIELAERNISTFASDNLKELPRGIPCENSSINFFSKEPKVVLYNKTQNKDYQFSNIGSDENYLSIHLALAFALQKFFHKNNSPVPGLLLLDQVSRPYYSNTIDSDELEIGEESDDERALKKHFDFIFKQVEENEGLQVIVLEHAYLSYYKKFKLATKYRWPRNCEEKLIPSDWPTM